MEVITENSPPRPNHIGKLVSIVNRDDRFKLFNDAAVEEGNLDNPIHPLFHPENLEQNKHMKQALQLASLYLTVPSLLEFFIPLTFGAVQKKGADDAKTRQCIYFSRASIARKDEIDIIAANLRCMAHLNTWTWSDFSGEERFKNTWGLTIINKDTEVTPQTDGCTKLDEKQSKYMFKPRVQTEIWLDNQMLAYYTNEETGYVTRSRSEQFRYDFQTAMVLCHEIAHAYGGLIYGRFKEPYLHWKHPTNELGYAWEHFLFGGRLDPPQKTSPESLYHLYRVWQNREVARAFAGDEYTAVPVTWTAQWFRKDTWEEITKHGYKATPQLPETTFKIYWSINIWRHIVYTDDEDARNDLRWGRDSSALSYLFSKGGYDAEANQVVARAFGIPMIDVAKASLIPTPPRHFDEVPQDDKPYLMNNQNRDYETWTALQAAKRELEKPNVLSVASCPMPTRTFPRKAKSGRRLRKLSVAGGPMSLSDSELSPTLPERYTALDATDFITDRYIGLRPEFYIDDRKNLNEGSDTSPIRYTSSSPPNLGKRSRNNDRSDSGFPKKKPRYNR